MRRSHRAGLAAVVAATALALVVPTSGAMAAPSADPTDAVEVAAPSVAVAEHVRTRMTGFDAAEVAWDLAETGDAPTAFVVELAPASGLGKRSVTVDGAHRLAAVPRLKGSTRFAVRVLVVDVDGVAKAPVAGQDLVTRSAVAAALDAAAAASSATAAAERAERKARVATAHVRHAHGRARIRATAVAKRARQHAHRLALRAAVAADEAVRARHRVMDFTQPVV